MAVTVSGRIDMSGTGKWLPDEEGIGGAAARLSESANGEILSWLAANADKVSAPQQFTRAELEAMVAPVVALMAESEPEDLLAVTREVVRGG